MFKILNISAYVVETREKLDSVIFRENLEYFQRDIFAILRDICVKAYGLKLISQTRKMAGEWLFTFLSRSVRTGFFLTGC